MVAWCGIPHHTSGASWSGCMDPTKWGLRRHALKTHRDLYGLKCFEAYIIYFNDLRCPLQPMWKNTPMCSANYPDKFAKFLGKQLCHAQWPYEKCCKGVSSRHENVCCSIGCFHSSTILSCRLAAEVFWLRHFKVLGLVNIWFVLVVDPSKNLHGKKGEFKPNISPRTQINAMWVWLRFCSSDIRHQTVVRALAALAAIFANVQPEEARRIKTLECLKAPSEPKNA